MKTKKYILVIGTLLLILILVTLGCYYVLSKKAPIQYAIDTSGPYDVNVSIKLNVSLGNNVKKFDSNIIRAARTAIFQFESGNSARRSHYKYNLSGCIDIFEIFQRGSNTWEVQYRFKNKPEEAYDTRFYSSVTVEKNREGRYNGNIVSSSPQDQGITY